jgi:hypothetical protein
MAYLCRGAYPAQYITTLTDVRDVIALVPAIDSSQKLSDNNKYGKNISVYNRYDA